MRPQVEESASCEADVNARPCISLSLLPSSRRRSCSASLVTNAPFRAVVEGTSHISARSARRVRSASAASAARRHSRAPCWQMSDSSVERCSSSSNSDTRMERTVQSTNATPTSMAPAEPLAVVVGRPSLTATMTGEVSTDTSPSRAHSSSKACRFPGEPRRSSTHSERSNV
jgi:hypothetical protein